MSAWSSTADVNARLTYAQALGAATKPTSTQVQAWLDSAEAQIRLALAAAGMPTTFTAGSDTIELLRDVATTYAIGLVKQAWASAEGDGGNDAGDRELERFDEFLRSMRDRKAYMSDLIEGGASDANILTRSHVTHHPDGKTIAAGDFRPKFTTGEVF